jgi:stage V sporulation protein B
MKTQSFLSGTLTLLGAGIITKALGALFIIPLTRLIGAEGVGLLQMASPVFVAVLVLAASGVPVATSKLVSERLAVGDESGSRQVVSVCLGAMIPVGISLSYALYTGAGLISAFMVRDPRVFFPLRCLSPAICFVTCSAVFRGYFQGLRIMAPTAVSNMTEQAVRVIVGLWLAYALLPRGVHWSAAGAAIGGSCGSLAGLLLLVTYFIVVGRGHVTQKSRWKPANLSTQSPDRRSFLSTLKEIVRLATPVTVASLVWPLQDFLNAAVIPARLQHIGFSVSRSAELYGHLSGMALGLVAVPSVVTTAMAINLVPQLSASHAKGQRSRTVQLTKSAVRGALLVGIPASVGLMTLPTEISALVFGDPGAGVPLRLMAFSATFLCLQQTTASVLNGVGKVGLPLRNGLIGAACATLANYVLTGIPGADIKGAALGIGLGFLITGILNMIDCGKLTGAGLRLFITGWRAAVGSVIMFPVVQGINALLLMGTLSSAVSASCAIFAGVLVYGLALIFLGELSSREIAVIPVLGNSLARALRLAGRPR